MSPNDIRKKLKPMPMLENTQDPGISGLMMHKEMKLIPMHKLGPPIAPPEKSSGIGGMTGGSGSRQDVDEK